jgi:hypothetical protein
MNIVKVNVGWKNLHDYGICEGEERQVCTSHCKDKHQKSYNNFFKNIIKSISSFKFLFISILQF